MDWNAAVEKNCNALKRVLAALLVMAGFAGGAPGTRPATLPRHLHRAVLRLLRPAEAAARRLVIVAARGLTVDLPPLRPRRRKTKRSPVPDAATGFRLFDPPSRWGRTRVRPSQVCVPRIAFPGIGALSPVRLPPMPLDPIDTTPLAHRLTALGRALDDLPRQAQRFARWRMRVSARFAGGEDIVPKAAGPVPAGRGGMAARILRVWPLRPGRPPGRRPSRDRRPAHEVHDILTGIHGLALWALEPADTS